MKKIKKKQFLSELLSICDQYPYLRNPVETNGGDPVCAYFAEMTQPGESQRCLLGEWMNRKGVPVQNVSNMGAIVLLERFLPTTTQAVRQLAQDIQVYADDESSPRQWKDVAAWIREHRPLEKTL